MYKKNYLTREEQNVWQYISNKEIIDNELVKCIFPDISANKRNKLLHSLYKKGYLNRARKDLYYNPSELKNFYEVALNIKNGYIGLNSALRHYNLIEYEDFTIFVMTKNFRKNVPLKGSKYNIQFIPLKNLFAGFKRADNIYISSIEKTIFDCFLKPGLVGFSNITKALYDAKIDWNDFIEFFKMSKNHALRQRTGYVLELMKKTAKLRVPDFVFKFLMKNIRYPVKLVSYGKESAFNKKWKIQDNVGEKNILAWWH